MPPDSTDTRRRLLYAAFEEFAAHGLAGARVDRIAELARANKRLIYAYYGNKEELFDTVMVRSLGVLTDAVPFSADDLPGYAGALFDHMIADPARRPGGRDDVGDRTGRIVVHQFPGAARPGGEWSH